MNISQDQTTVLVWSDNDFLCDIIMTNLHGLHLTVQRAGSEETVQNLAALLIVALSSSSNEPALASLSQATLARQAGHIPLLIISDRPFKADPTNRIYHLDFPFSADQLHCAVQSLLSVQTSNFSHDPNRAKGFLI